jgi:hypothetical protein
MKQILEAFGINITISVAGLFGSLILVGKDSANTWKTTMFSIITGIASANYLTPVFADLLRMDEKYQMSLAFILGFLGLKGVEVISDKLVKKVKTEKPTTDVNE